MKPIKTITSNSTESGVAALISILAVSVVALSISISITLLGVGDAKNSLDFKRGQEAMKIAESCAEEGLLRLRNDNQYTGTGAGSLNVGSGSCIINISGIDENREILVEASILGPPDFVKRLQVDVVLSTGSVNVVNWIETE